MKEESSSETPVNIYSNWYARKMDSVHKVKVCGKENDKLPLEQDFLRVGFHGLCQHFPTLHSSVIKCMYDLSDWQSRWVKHLIKKKEGKEKKVMEERTMNEREKEIRNKKSL